MAQTPDLTSPAKAVDGNVCLGSLKAQSHKFSQQALSMAGKNLTRHQLQNSLVSDNEPTQRFDSMLKTVISPSPQN